MAEVEVVCLLHSHTLVNFTVQGQMHVNALNLAEVLAHDFALKSCIQTAFLYVPHTICRDS